MLSPVFIQCSSSTHSALITTHPVFVMYPYSTRSLALEME